MFNAHTFFGGLAIGGGFISWLYGKTNYAWIYDAISNAKDLDTNEDHTNGYYCIEGPVHSENPIQDINPTNGVNIINSCYEEIEEYVRLDETVYCVLENSTTRVERDEFQICIGYMTVQQHQQHTKSVKDVKKSHTNSKIAYPITVNNVNIDEFVESIPLIYINRIFKPQNEMLGAKDDDEIVLPRLSTKDLNSKLMIGFEFEKQGVPIASKVTIFGWYDAENKRMKRRIGKGVVHVVDCDTEEDKCNIIDIKSQHKPVLVTRSSRKDVEEHYKYLTRKWNGIGFSGILLGVVLIGFKFFRK